VVTERGTERTGELLVDELDLLGLSSQLERGQEHAAEAGHDRSEHRAVVWLHDDHQARIWLKGEDSSRPHDVASSESPELLALRTAELLRGRLLPGDEPAQAATEADAAGPASAHALRFHMAAGPGIVVSSYAEPLPTFNLAFGYRPWPRLSVGAFTTGSLVPNAWQGYSDQLTTSQFSVGGRLGLLWLEPPGSGIRSHLLLRGAIRGLQVRSPKGGPMEKGSALLWGPTVDLGLDGEYELTPWFSLGVELCFIVGFPLTRSASLDNGMAPGAMSPILVATENLGPDFQVATSFLAMARW